MQLNILVKHQIDQGIQEISKKIFAVDFIEKPIYTCRLSAPYTCFMWGDTGLDTIRMVYMASWESIIR